MQLPFFRSKILYDKLLKNQGRTDEKLEQNGMSGENVALHNTSIGEVLLFVSELLEDDDEEDT